MFKVGDYVTPDLEAIGNLSVNDRIRSYIGTVQKVSMIDTNHGILDLEGIPAWGWVAEYWKLAVTPETTFKLIKKYAE